VVAILLSLALGLIGASGELVRILTAPAYHAAASIVPVLVLAYVVYSLDPLLRFGLLLHHRTRTVLGIVTASCLVNIGANLALIPVMGLMGAACATLAAFVALVGLDFVLARAHFRFQLEWGTLAVVGAAFIVVMLASRLVRIDNPWAGLAVKCAVFLAYPAILAVSGIFRHELGALMAVARTFLRGRRGLVPSETGGGE
jgi:O-antigen/teichoic acid export membrane protein